MKFAKVLSMFDGKLEIAVMIFKSVDGEHPSIKFSFLDSNEQNRLIELVPEQSKSGIQLVALLEDPQLHGVLHDMLVSEFYGYTFTDEHRNHAFVYHGFERYEDVLFIDNGEGDGVNAFFVTDDSYECKMFEFEGLDLDDIKGYSDHELHYLIELAMIAIEDNHEGVVKSTAGQLH
ncbi:hypothetical protein [Vibrio mediterranei]|uniref:hypothetical protein n=1 Tax=Vibrio mediterranei TaxID=689 RepID=UPI0040677597